MKESDGQIHVLLVDDEEDFLAATATALKRRHFVVTTAANGDAALIAMQQDTPHVVVLDVKMPGISGDDLYRMINSRWQEVPVVMLTGHGSVQHAFTSSRRGVVEYLAKPCEMERLAKVLRKVVFHSPRQASPRRAPDTDSDIRVLVVDSEPELLRGVAQILRKRGMGITTASEGGEALAQLRKREPDVVLLDLSLPGEKGLDLLDRIKGSHPSVEVIVQTGHPTAEDAVEAMRKGAFDYQPKPLESSKLLTRIRAAYHRRQQRCREAERGVIQDILEQRPD